MGSFCRLTHRLSSKSMALSTLTLTVLFRQEMEACNASILRMRKSYGGHE